jgi:uridine kinase
VIRKIKVTIPDGRRIALEKGARLVEIFRKLNNRSPRDMVPCPVVGARVHNSIRELSDRLDKDASVRFLDCTNEDGVRIYSRGLSFVLIKAVSDVFPDARTIIEHSLSKGLFCEIDFGRPLMREDVERIDERMRQIIKSDFAIEKRVVPKEEALEIFGAAGQYDKVLFLKHLRKKMVTIYGIERMYDYFFGHMPPSTGYLRNYELLYYPPGIVLRFPSAGDGGVLPSFTDIKKIALVFFEFKKWGRILNIGDVGALNEIISNGEFNDIVRVAEALQEKKIAQIADLITGQKERLRLILIAGPSSSGKTTFSHRLSVQLRVNGMKPVPISIDDYFKDRELSPRDEFGQFDFECLEAVDVALFNEHLRRLIWGEEVELPRFDFVEGRRKDRGRRLKVSPEHLLIVEGIHALNERLTESIPKHNKYKIYISALTQLNLDNHNRIPTTDVRLIRRIVRDFQFRGHSALDTIRMWPSVRRGEEKNIFPFQEEADTMFNSALVYEMAVLKGYAEPLLRKIKPGQPEYSEAGRLLSFIEYFQSGNNDEIPPNSILREFIGAACFFKAL